MNPASYIALGAASKVSSSFSALVAGSDPSTAAAEIAKVPGVSKVIVAKDKSYDHGLPEHHAPLISAATKAGGFTHVFAAHTAFGKNVMPRAAAQLDVAQVSDITGIEGADTFIRPIYAGNAMAKVKSDDVIKVVTVRGTAFEPLLPAGGSATSEDAAAAPAGKAKVEWISEDIVKSDRPELAASKVVVGGGRGLKSAENFELLYKLADKLGGAVGASRAAVDAGYANNDLQIGQTGKIIAPELYIAVGISGAIQHLAGMKDSKTIVAINKVSQDGERLTM